MKIKVCIPHYITQEKIENSYNLPGGWKPASSVRGKKEERKKAFSQCLWSLIHSSKQNNYAVLDIPTERANYVLPVSQELDISITVLTDGKNICEEVLNKYQKFISVNEINLDDSKNLVFEAREYLLNPTNTLMNNYYKKFYVFCPLFVTGGPEALHQLCSGLNDLGFDAYMYYYRNDNTCIKLEIPTISDYSHYNVKRCPDYIKNISDLNHEDNIIIIPEIVNRNIFSNNFKSKLVYWFLSCNLDGTERQFKDPSLLKYYIACQSQEVYDRVMKVGFLNKKKCFKLSDYTRQKFIHIDDNLRFFDRKNFITFCFKKKQSESGFYHYEKIFNIMRDYENNFIEIKDLSSEQIKNLGLKSKIYIDFSAHPGKDRVPREMASTGCIVITGNQNVASNDIDVPLEKRKFIYDPTTDSYDYEKIVEQIKYDLENYESAFNEQFNYRELIRKEKEVFISEIKNMINLIKK